MRHGTINADGFGVGWYAAGIRPAPAVYRRAVPMWADASFDSFAGVVSSGCVLAAVRSATPGMPVEESATAPFTDGRVLLSHNGRVRADAVGDLLAAQPSPRVPESRCDAAVLAALLFTRLASESGSGAGSGSAAGAGSGTGAGSGAGSGSDVLAEIVAGVVTDVGAADPAARLNLLAVDGTTVVATTWGDTLSYRVTATGTEVASEPDGLPGWIDVADRTLLVATEVAVTLRDLT